MPRPRKNKMVSVPPVCSVFKPQGVQRTELETVTITLEEFEAIRLADYKGLEHSEAAELMEISRSTFTRLIERARGKVSRFITEGTELVIEGGNIHFRENIIECGSCNEQFRTPINREIIKCPSCGSSEIINRARGFGHGSCCRRNFRRGR